MWFGSYNGLLKHEGTSIKIYKKDSKDSSSLSSNEMHGVFEDRLGFIWAGTTGGLDKLNPKTGIITHVKLRSAKRADNWIGYILSIFQDDKDDIWVVTETNLFIVNYETGKFTEVSDNEKSGKGMPDIELLYKSSVKTNTGIWMFTSGYMVFYDFKLKQFFHSYNNPQQKAIFRLSENSNTFGRSELGSDSLNNLYFIYKNEMLIKYNVVTDKLDSFRFEFPKNAWRCCYSVASDYKGNVWIGFRYGGLLLFNNNTHQFTPIRNNDANSLIQSDYVYSLCEDYLKRMWVTTNNGIFIVNYYDSTVQQKYLSDKKAVINIDYPSAIISQDEAGNIYIPFKSVGLFKYDIHSGNSRFFPVPDKMIKRYGYVYTDENKKTYISDEGTLFQATASGNGFIFSATDGKMEGLLKKDPSDIEWMYKYNQNAMYIKKDNGFIYYYNGTDILEKIAVKGFSKQACISYNGKYLYFLNMNSDIVKRDLATLKMDTLPLSKKLQALNFSYTNNRDIADDGNGNIWLTSQNGLIKYNLGKREADVYTTADGLLHDFSFTLCADSKKRLWVGSMGGVNLYDAEKNSFINVFSESPDKLSNYFGSSLEAKNGHIYFLFGGKLVNINPDYFFKQKIRERLLQLDEVRVNGEAINILSNRLPDLPYWKNRVYFRFGLLEFTEPEKVKYYYQLQGVNKSWIDLGNHSEISFNSLQPGNYTLNIKATDAYGNMVKEQVFVHFTIKPPFWKTWWFILLISAGLASLVYSFVKWRERNIKLIDAEKLKVEQLNAEQYKSKLEMEQIVNYFSSSIIDKHSVDEVLWDVAKNLIGQLGFVDCMIYLWNADKTKMIQKAGFGPKDSVEQINKQLFDVLPGQGVVGYVMQTKEAVLIGNTSKDSRYRADDLVRLSEITVPIIYNKELLGVIDSEHPEKGFYTQLDLQLLTTISTLVATKIKSIEAEQNIQQKQIEILSMNEQLSKAKLEALRSQMNPHFIFNSLNAIQECILTNNVAAAYKYLSKFSKLQRMVLNNSQKELIPLSDETEMLQLYLSLESLRFSKSFTYHIDMAGVTDINEIMVPSLLTQPLVENAIWHGLRNKEGDKTLSIIYKEENGQLLITIDDNGIGREAAAVIKKQKIGSEQFASKGTIILQQRLYVLSQQLKTDIQLQTIDKTDESGNAAGTKVTISFPSNLETTGDNF
jgi:LytS/YehU family sensor histidine kinase/ligand-binding sensor domain-containing protein